MDREKFAIIMPVLINGLIDMIINETEIKENEVFEKLYNSKLYEFIEREETKVWTYSVPMLFDLFVEEITFGNFKLPEY